MTAGTQAHTSIDDTHTGSKEVGTQAYRQTDTGRTGKGKGF